MVDYMKNLRDELYYVMYKRDWTFTRMAVECGMCCENLRDIMAGKRQSMRVSTLMEICEGTGISLSKVFGLEEQQKEEINWRTAGHFYLTNGREKYYLTREDNVRYETA